MFHVKQNSTLFDKQKSDVLVHAAFFYRNIEIYLFTSILSVNM